MRRHILMLLLTMFSAVAFASPSYLYYTGDGYVAAGNTDTVSSVDGFDFRSTYPPSRNELWFTIDDFATNPVVENAQFFWLYLAAPPGNDLQIGLYENATRAPFLYPFGPGLWFAGNGRGSNQITGYFRILDIQFASDDTVTSLAVDFMQNEENGYLGQTYGSFRFQSDIPITTVPEPSSIVLVISLLVFLAGLIRHQNRV